MTWYFQIQKCLGDLLPHSIVNISHLSNNISRRSASCFHSILIYLFVLCWKYHNLPDYLTVWVPEALTIEDKKWHNIHQLGLLRSLPHRRQTTSQEISCSSYPDIVIARYVAAGNLTNDKSGQPTDQQPLSVGHYLTTMMASSHESSSSFGGRILESFCNICFKAVKSIIWGELWWGNFVKMLLPKLYYATVNENTNPWWK